jgi:hypothetical protein
MINPIKLIAILLLGKSFIVNANTSSIMPLASRGSAALKSKSSALSSVAATTPTTALELSSTTRDATTDIVVKNIIPRGGGGGGEGGLNARLKVGSYFALWYILNIIYNSELREPSYIIGIGCLAE